MFKFIKRMFNRKEIIESLAVITFHKRGAMLGNFGSEVLVLKALKVIKDNYGLKEVYRLTAELGMTPLVNNWVSMAKNSKYNK